MEFNRRDRGAAAANSEAPAAAAVTGSAQDPRSIINRVLALVGRDGAPASDEQLVAEWCVFFGFFFFML